MKKVVLFGTYNADYPRNRLLSKFFKKLEIETISINYRGKGIGKYFRMAKELRGLTDYDVILVGFPGSISVIAARLVSKKPIIFDAFLSLYDTYVYDRKSVHPYSLKARWYRMIDKLSCRLATYVMVDTPQHADYFHSELGVPEAKLHAILVSTDIALFTPAEKKMNNASYTIFWHGKYSPLHNVELILEAANILRSEPEFAFQLLGSGGQEYDTIRSIAAKKKLTNVNFLPSVPYDQLPHAISQADLCLGMFGKSDKVDRVVPNKIYEYLACGKVVITRNSSACRDILGSSEIFYLEHGTVQELVEQIRKIRHDKGSGYLSHANRRESENLEEKAFNSFNKLITTI